MKSHFVRGYIFSLICIFCLLPITLWAENDALSSERLAQWDINYASYLIDVGKYLEALDAYNTAYEVTVYRKTKLKALLYKANLLSTFLDAEKEALEIYDQIIKEYPEGEEIALYRKGLLLFDMGRFEEATKVLEVYVKKYPKGRFIFQVEVLLEKAKKAIVKPVPKVKRPKVRVLLHRRVKKVAIEGKGLLIDGKSIPKNAISCYLKNGAIYINGSEFSSPVTISAKSPLKVISGRNKKTVRGRISLKVKDNNLMVTNIIDIENYLLSVVPSESYASWPLETLKAQAVAARTYAIYQALHRKNWEYDLVDNEGDQAYRGVEREDPRSTKAVIETEGLVLIEEKRPILAMYTANSGGYTASAGSIFKLYKSYLIAHPDPASLKGKMSHWKKAYTVKQVERALRGIGLKIRGLQDILPAEKGPSGRIIKVRIVAKRGGGVFRTRTTLRRALKLPEILFSIHKSRDKFIFEGRGWGHGVGYSQWGAEELGKAGKSFSEILSFYYPNTRLKKLW